jgi:phage terminase small subunit
MNCSGKGTKMAKVAEKPTSGKRMTQQQQDFLNNFMHKDMTQTAAAREAGYANPNVDAVRILNRPIIQERIQEMRAEMENKFGVTITKSIRDLQRLRDDAWASGNFSAAIKAEELRLKATGQLVSKTHTTHEHIDSMTREEILGKLQSVMQTAQERMRDVTPSAELIEQSVSDNENEGESGE